MLPACTLRVALPKDTTATSLTITQTQTTILAGTYTIYPTQPPQKIGTSDPAFTQPDPDIYQSTTPYPATTTVLNDNADLAGQTLTQITIYPIHYTGATRQLTLTTSLTLTITLAPRASYGDYLPANANQADMTRNVQSMVINPQDVQLQTSSKPHTTGVGAGDYDYVIITSTSWVSAFQSLADWKTQKGVPATIVTTDWIYNEGGYSGTNQNKIKSFFEDAYSTWGATFFLLGGDTNTVPCSTKSFPSVDYDPVPNDTFYADYDQDYICEVNVGRASVTGPGTGSGQIGNFITKILTYEQTPYSGLATKAGFYGFDLDGSTHGEQCKITIDNTYIPASWTMTNVYDSQGGNHATAVVASINAGQNLMNHADHSGSDYMGTGYVNHYTGLGNSDMDALTNGVKQGILYSMGCDPCAYDVSACIAEHFVRNANGGGNAFVGNSRYGWYNPGYTNTLSMKFDIYFFRSIFDQGFTKLGAAFTDHKNDAISADDYYRYVFTELTLLGDPEMPIWTDTPGTLTVNAPGSMPIGSSTYKVTVTSGGSPVSGATVCLWKGTDVYLVGTTDASGSYTFHPAPTTEGNVKVTVTKQNFLPVEKTAVVGGSGGDFRISLVSGGFFGLSARIQNKGSTAVTNVHWTISLEGGSIWTDSTFEGDIASIPAGGSEVARASPILGFGSFNLTVSASGDGVPDAYMATTGVALLFLILAS